MGSTGRCLTCRSACQLARVLLSCCRKYRIAASSRCGSSLKHDDKITSDLSYGNCGRRVNDNSPEYRLIFTDPTFRTPSMAQ